MVSGRSRAVAGAVGFPVVALKRGVSGRLSIGGWAGADEAPDQISLRYGDHFDPAALGITTYPVNPWESWEDLVGSTYTSVWQADQMRRRYVAEAAEQASASGVDIHEVRFGARSLRQDRKSVDALAADAQRAQKQAPRSSTSVEFEDQRPPVYLCGDAELWAAGFTTEQIGGAITVLLHGRGAAIETLALKLVSDLVAELDRH